jgi:tetratricopeptide (TPR) repeat protein
LGSKLGLAVSQACYGRSGIQSPNMNTTAPSMNPQLADMRRLCVVRLLCVAAILTCSSATVLAQADANPCGGLENGYGPYDYLMQKDKLPIVEQFHFTPEVERLVAGKSTVNIGGDLSYTLKAFPNHHRALLAMARLGARLHTPQPVGAAHSVECFFERALRFRPQDTTARMLYANYLFDTQRQPDALLQMQTVADEAGDHAFTHYNLGLIYLERKHYDLSLQHAQKAYALGMTQPGLRQQLERLGKWQNAAPAN